MAIWCVCAAVVVGMMLTGSRERTVLHAYRLGAERWMASEPLYDLDGKGFLYLPQSAILFIPWDVMPYWWGESLWRAFNVAVLAAGTYVFCRVVQPQLGRRIFALTSLVAAALAWPSIRTGQTTIILTGLMLFALSDLIRERWLRATASLWLAFAFKPILLPLLLLVPVLWPKRMAGRMLLGGLITAATPFLFQRPDYVLAQYQLFPVMLKSAAAFEHEQLFTQLFGMLAAFGYQVPDPIPTAIRAGFGLATLVAAWLMKRKLPPREFGLFLGSLVAAYILVFSPRTESNTYALIGPFLGCLLALRLIERRITDVALLATLAVLIIGTYEIGKPFLNGNGNHVLAPLATMVFAGWLWRDGKRIARENAAAAAPTAETLQSRLAA